MASLHRQYKEICLREATEQELRSDLKTVWDNFSNKRRLDINVRFSRQRPTVPLMLMPPGAVDGPAIYSPSPPWTTPNFYFVSLPVLPASDQLKRSKSGGSDEPPDDMIDQCSPFLLNTPCCLQRRPDAVYIFTCCISIKTFHASDVALQDIQHGNIP
jgi:hypothetical protein